MLCVSQIINKLYENNAKGNRWIVNFCHQCAKKSLFLCSCVPEDALSQPHAYSSTTYSWILSVTTLVCNIVNNYVLPQAIQHLTYSNDISWWRHKMETFSALLALRAGNSAVIGEFPSQRPVTRSFDIFFDVRLKKCLRKQSWGL